MIQRAVAPDSVRAVLDTVFAGPAYDWRERRDPLGFLREWLAWLQQALDRLAAEHPLAFFVLLFALTCVLAAILTHFAYLVWRSLRGAREAAGAGPARVAQVRDEAWHLAAFRRLLADERYAEAMAERFAALVLHLGARAALRPDQSKTPAEYAAEARLDAAGRSVLASLVDDLYRRVFGGVPCTADDVQRFDAEAGTLGGRVATS